MFIVVLFLLFATPLLACKGTSETATYLFVNGIMKTVEDWRIIQDRAEQSRRDWPFFGSSFSMETDTVRSATGMTNDGTLLGVPSDRWMNAFKAAFDEYEKRPNCQDFLRAHGDIVQRCFQEGSYAVAAGVHTLVYHVPYECPFPDDVMKSARRFVEEMVTSTANQVETLGTETVPQ